MNVDHKTMLELLDEVRLPEQQEGDMSLVEMAEYLDVSSERASVVSRKMVKEGSIIKINGILTTGRRGNFYRPK